MFGAGEEEEKKWHTDSLLSVTGTLEENGALALGPSSGVQQDIGSDDVAGLPEPILQVLPRGSVGQLGKGRGGRQNVITRTGTSHDASAYVADEDLTPASRRSRRHETATTHTRMRMRVRMRVRVEASTASTASTDHTSPQTAAAAGHDCRREGALLSVLGVRRTSS